jgi:PTH2 family peptidyl-tRNA hydrolase
MTTSDAPKMVIVVRNELKMRKGKIGAQCSHAASAFMKESWLNGIAPTPLQKEWLEPRENGLGREKKIVLRTESEPEFWEIVNKAKRAGLLTREILDSGLTEFDGPTYTCVAIGPDLPAKIDPITGHLKPL